MSDRTLFTHRMLYADRKRRQRQRHPTPLTIPQRPKYSQPTPATKPYNMRYRRAPTITPTQQSIYRQPTPVTQQQTNQLLTRNTTIEPTNLLSKFSSSIERKY